MSFIGNIKTLRRNCVPHLNGCGHTWDLTLVKGFNRGKTDVKKLYYSKTPDGFPKEMCHSNDEPEDR